MNLNTKNSAKITVYLTFLTNKEAISFIKKIERKKLYNYGPRNLKELMPLVSDIIGGKGG